MSQVVDAASVPHLQMHEEDDHDDEIIDIELRPTEPEVRRSPRVPKSIRSAEVAPKRARFVALLIASLVVVAVSVALAVHYSGASVKASHGEGTVMPTTPVVPQTSEPAPFLKAKFDDSGTSVFVLQKAHWNESFIVYPTVVKHSAPPHSGMERGSILLDTSDYVFHFELSLDSRFLLLVMENHLTKLQSEEDELKQVFENSQWPGYVASVAIYMETEEAYYFAMEPILSHGFFVSGTLMTSYFTVIPTASAFFPRNMNLQVEYEIEDGIVQVNYAVGLLPETVMPQRAADDRVGYFMRRYIRYGVNNTDARDATAEGTLFMDPEVTVINRRRLVVDETTGNTTNPIVYYIDPSVPKRWRQAFADGVTAWAPAFEQIGFKNAIKVVQPGDVEWPIDYRIGDLRYNSISVMISDQTYAYGPIVVDPRSGEILHSDITFEYGFFDEVVTDFDFHSPVAPPTNSHVVANTSKMHLRGDRQCGIGKSSHYHMDRTMLGMLLGTKNSAVPEWLMGRHFTDIVMHEVGHTLGLRHNFAGSALVSRSELAQKSFTTKRGISSSIMDYIPASIYSDLTESKVHEHEFYQSVIGPYDMAAIAYGYAIVDDEAPGYRSKQLSALAQKAPLFLTDEDADMWSNPYAQRFDLSSDPIDYANDRLELVKAMRNASLVNKLMDDAPLPNLWKLESTLLRMINTTVQIVQPFLGGVNVTHAHYKAGQPTYTAPFIPEADQLRALNVLTRIIRAEAGLFPDPSQYASLIQTMGYGENCAAPSNDYGCLGRALVNVDELVKYGRQNAVMASILPALDRIIVQDVNSPLSVHQILEAVQNAANANPKVARNQPIASFVEDVFIYFVESETEDPRLKAAITAFVNGTASPSSS